MADQIRVEVPIIGIPIEVPVADNAALQATLVAVARFSMAEAVARQTNLRPSQVLAVIERYIATKTAITEFSMAEIVDDSVLHITSGKGLL
jgi:hypothetical protein